MVQRRLHADAASCVLDQWRRGRHGCQSDLVRDDPNKGQKYRNTSITNALKYWNGVGYTGAPPAPALPGAAPAAPALPATAASRIEATVAAANASIGSVGYLSTPEQTKLFAGCVYIENRHMVLMPDGRLLAPANFRSAFGGGEFQMQTDSAIPTRNAFEAFTENRMMQFPEGGHICFRPSAPAGAILPGRLVNIWRPPVIDEARRAMSRHTWIF